MLKEVRARYEKGRLVVAEGAEAPPDGAEVVVVYQTPPPAAPRRAQDGGTEPVEGAAEDSDDELYGSWAGKFPADFDIEKELREIRSGWKRRLGDAPGRVGSGDSAEDTRRG